MRLSVRVLPSKTILQQGLPYLHRWHIIPRNRLFNIYLHHVVRSDDDRALHDHPWWNLSIILRGGYYEHMPERTVWRGPGTLVLRKANALHRLQLNARCHWHQGKPAGIDSIPCWSLFITGPRIRDWGFACPKGWVSWRKFLDIPTGQARGHEVGPGCGEA